MIENDKISSNMLNENIKMKDKISLRLKLFIGALIIIVISLVISVIFLVNKKPLVIEKIIYKEGKSERETQSLIAQEGDNKDYYDLIKEKAGYKEPWYDLYGNRIVNISYAQNNIIPNSFKVGDVNYNLDIGNINEGKDYNKNERNIYNLFIPYTSLDKKNKHNGIILFIHGGQWTGGYKEDVENFSSRYAKQGYITATMEYTVLSENYTEYNIFRILDEITVCIKSILEELKIQGFNENKLELALGGVSSGAHIALLYGYSQKNHLLPIKFMIDIVGPVSLEKEYWYKPSLKNKTLENIEKLDIETAIKKEKITGVYENEFTYIYLMNLFLGKKYTNAELIKMVNDNKIIINNAKYQEMLKIVENAFPVKYISNNPIPLLCEYCGNDLTIGIAHYSYLKELSLWK